MISKELLVWHAMGGKIGPLDIVSLYEEDFNKSKIFQSYIQACNLSGEEIDQLRTKNVITKLSRDFSHSVNDVLRIKKALEEGNNHLASVILKYMFM
jgi:hypothetical protein